MYKKILFSIACAVISGNLCAQTLSFTPSSDGKTLTINASGNLPEYSGIDESKKVFTDLGAQNVYVNNYGDNYSPVGSGNSYDPSATYYASEKTWSQLFDGGAPTTEGGYVQSVTVEGNWNTAAIGEKNIYEFQIQWDNSISIKGSSNQYPTFNNNYLTTEYTEAKYTTYLVMTSTTYNSEVSVSALPEDGVILDKNNISSYTTQVTKYTCAWQKALYISTDGGETKTQLTAGQQYTYNEGETFYTYEETKALIEDNASFFAEHSDYLRVSPSYLSAVQIISNNINAGAYENVVFANDGNADVITINGDIVCAILYPLDNSSNRTNNTDIVNLNLGAATLPGFNANDFVVSTESYRFGQLNLEEVTLPLVPAVDGVVEVPSNILSNFTIVQKTVNVPEGYTKMGYQAFYNAAKVSKVVLPSTMVTLGESSFEGMMALRDINLPEGLVTIGKKAFFGCYLASESAGLPNPVFPSTLKRIEAAAYANILSITDIKLNEGLEFIGNSAFALSSASVAEVLDIPSTVKYVGPCAFYWRTYQDVYFHSETAPVSPYGVSVIDPSAKAAMFSDDCYMGNNGFGKNLPTADDYEKGYGNRDNYYNGKYFIVIHYPDGLTEEQEKTYKDTTREYIKYYVKKSDNSVVKAEYGKTYDPEEYMFFWNWAGGGYEFGDETTSLTYGTETATKVFGSGLEDTYEGAQTIWPSQGQWMRAFITVANGVEWNGVTAYAPTLSDEQIQYMLDDNLVLANGAAITGDKVYTDDEVNAYNATLEGAWVAPVVKEEAVYYTEDELTEVDGKTYVTETLTWVEATDEEEAHYEVTEYSKEATTETVKTEATYYSQDEINAHNAALEGAMAYGYTVSNLELYANELSIQAYQGTRRCVLGAGNSNMGEDYNIDLKNEHWWTICLPFNLTKTQIDEVFGEGTHVCKFNKVDRSEAEGVLKFYFTDDKYAKATSDNDVVLKAHEAYMIYPKKNADSYTVKNPQFETGNPNPTIVVASDGTNYRYVGNYAEEGTKIPEYSYFYAKKKNDTKYKFWFAQNGNIAWKANKCVIQGTAKDQGLNDNTTFFGATANNTKLSTILFGEEDDEDVTAIEQVEIIVGEDTTSATVYNLNGQVVGHNGLNGLNKGVYIVNGKKYIVK